ncbi:hypothetical protein [Clostridium culturomicium]|uniref:hypothetical protein n=1 Tax=Clostridium culturomicium TaxID=1499683 RepID=UPI0038577EAB
MNIIKFILILWAGQHLIKFVLGSNLTMIMIKPLTNKKIKNKFINLIIIFRINYLNILDDGNQFEKELYNKILLKEELRKADLSFLNKHI